MTGIDRTGGALLGLSYSPRVNANDERLTSVLPWMQSAIEELRELGLS